jgi:hypothetical protein
MSRELFHSVSGSVLMDAFGRHEVCPCVKRQCAAAFGPAQPPSHAAAVAYTAAASANAASFTITCAAQQVLNKHRAMRGVVVHEVQQYLHRPGLAPKALYAGVVFLSQVGAGASPQSDADTLSNAVASTFAAACA